MQKFLLICSLFFISFAGLAQKKALPVVSFDKIPQTVEEFISLRDKHATTPQGGAAIWVLAAVIYAQNAELGRQCLIIASDKSLLGSSNKGYQGFDFGNNSDYLIKQMDSKKYVPNSYIQGTSFETGYKLGNAPYKIACFTNPYSGNEAEGRLKVFVQCTGADSDRPITLVRNDKGIWKAIEFSSLVVGIKAPKQKSKGAAEGDF
jgi:hypothetical protein